VATQPGVQGRDLTSFLLQLESWSNRHHTPLYILRRDQQKGFNKLEPQGFYDAIAAYGLPQTIVDFDLSAQSDVPYCVHTAYGLTEPLTITGVTKQGGPISPLKSTLMTSLGNHWLHDLFQAHQDGVIISSIQHMDHREHVPADHLSLALAMCEATDDSLLIVGSLQSLERSCLAMERFQAAYGWLTNWDKSAVFILNVPDPPVSLLLPSVLPANPASQVVCMHSVRVIPSHVEFLCVSVNDPLAQFARIQDIIISFTFPHLHCQLPLTTLRRIISQCLVSRICPLLAFQPITRTQAQQLDHMIAHLVHDYYRFPFHFHSTLLSLPIDLFGMGFPSISCLNDTLALQGMLRDLNHHIPAFRIMAAITLSDWMCSLNHCVYPLDGPSV
ncbi:hypothetical protein BDR05DRAFT_835286, partial [Suillus weaverae]